MVSITRDKPQAIVTFHTETGDLVARATNDPNSAIDDDVVSIQTSRDMSADSPTFSINLTRRKHWHKWIASNDLITIVMQRPPEAKATVFVGLVDDCRKRVTMSNNSVQRVITITGRGVAKSLIQFDIGIVPEAEFSFDTIGWLVSNGITLAGSSSKLIIESVWNNIAKEHVDYKWSNGRNLFSIMKHSLRDKPHMKLFDDSGIINYQGSLWAFMKGIAEDPFQELFWEIYDNSPTMMLRPTPFNAESWNALPIIFINDEDVVMDELGKSDVETHTLFSVGAKSFFSANDTYKTLGSMPLWYKPYYDKYGIRRLHVESSYLAFSDSSDLTSVDIMRELQEDLFNWNIKNNAMLNGTFILKGSNRYKVGVRLRYESLEDDSTTDFYIKSVKHDFVNFNVWTTTVEVTRGLAPEHRFSSPVGEFEEYSGSGLANFDPDAATQAMKNGTVTTPTISGDFLGKSNDVVKLAYDILLHGINGVKVKYTFGGTNASRGQLDCSSFTQYVYKNAAGMELGRTTGNQVLKGTKVDRGAMQPGDLLFFKNTYDSSHVYGVSHVGIYIGDGNMIHNSGSKDVNLISIDDPYWVSHYLMSRRVLQPEVAGGTTFSATAYGATALNLGAGPNYVPTGKTKLGTVPLEGRTIAVDPDVIPLGSKVAIQSMYPGITGNYVAEDIGSAIKGNRIDIYFNDLPPYDAHKARERMLKFGKRDIKVTIIERGKGS